MSFLPPNVTNRGYQIIPYAPTITPDPYLGETIEIGTLTGNLTLNVPLSSNPGFLPPSGYPGCELTFVMTNDSTTRIVTLDPVYSFVSGVLAWAPNKRNVYKFIYNGTRWLWNATSSNPYTP